MTDVDKIREKVRDIPNLPRGCELDVVRLVLEAQADAVEQWFSECAKAAYESRGDYSFEFAVFACANTHERIAELRKAADENGQWGAE